MLLIHFFVAISQVFGVNESIYFHIHFQITIFTNKTKCETIVTYSDGAFVKSSGAINTNCPTVWHLYVDVNPRERWWSGNSEMWADEGPHAV